MLKPAVFVAGLLLGATGDVTLTYNANDRVDITGADAATIADCFIAVNAWTGNRIDIDVCSVYRQTGGTTAFGASCSGEKAELAGDVDVPVTVTEISIEE
jgi:hypothetical protein